MIKARNEGRDFLREGRDILEAAAKNNPALDAALGLWGEISFDYTSTDMPDAVATPSV